MDLSPECDLLEGSSTNCLSGPEYSNFSLMTNPQSPQKSSSDSVSEIIFDLLHLGHFLL